MCESAKKYTKVHNIASVTADFMVEFVYYFYSMVMD